MPDQAFEGEQEQSQPLWDESVLADLEVAKDGEARVM